MLTFTRPPSSPACSTRSSELFLYRLRDHSRMSVLYLLWLMDGPSEVGRWCKVDLGSLFKVPPPVFYARYSPPDQVRDLGQATVHSPSFLFVKWD